ncbi:MULTISPECIES: M24 family metallopeptidase [unclassified Streptomyces]|uniref:M24 family metallopeptidase n=1 Tax=unclassified Streptomyces TaxID=2593676 RepID=UPI0033BFD2A8
MAAPDRMDERLRALGLVEGQRMAQALFAEVAARGLIVPGRSEREVSDRIGALAREAPAWGRCGSWWAVRSGPHSALPAAQEPPEDRIITEDDMVIVDLGPLLAGYESGFVRTVATGRDPHKRRLAEDLPRLFTAAREVFHADRTLTGSHLHAEIQTLATKAGWTLAGRNAGHTVGTDADDAPPEAYITPADDRPLRRTTKDGWQAHWLLEINLLDEHGGFGGSHKGLLDLA